MDQTCFRTQFGPARPSRWVKMISPKSANTYYAKTRTVRNTI
jgi:hypothetical protein